MKISIPIVLVFLLTGIVYPEVQLKLYNSAYAYNGENGVYWDETRYTLTYFEDLVQPYIFIKMNQNVELSLGSGFLIPFNQEEKIYNYYPFVRTKLILDEYSIILGSLEGNHNFPPCMLDPLVNITPELRIQSKTQIPITYETYKYGIFSHGLYEYGIQLKQQSLTLGKMDAYMNWQLPDTEYHRERFDVGLIYMFDPFYTGLHYWHNGGHEHPHIVAVTENYNAAAGLRNDLYSILYVVSYYLPDRDSHPELNVFGQGLYGEYNFNIYGWKLQAQGFISDKFIDTNHQYIAVEADPFYRVPLYFGFNISRAWKLGPETTVNIGFVNGGFLPYTDTKFDWKMIRYDQFIKIDMEYSFDLDRHAGENTK